MAHKKKINAMKKSVKGVRSGFDRSKLNNAFFNNAKTQKDEVAGWAFDFNNDGAGGNEGGGKNAPHTKSDKPVTE